MDLKGILGTKHETRPESARQDAVAERLRLIQGELDNAQTILETFQSDQVVIPEETNLPATNITGKVELVPGLEQIRDTVGAVYQEIRDAA